MATSERKVLLSEMTWPEVEESLKETDLAVLPVGCTEEHGPHLPINADTFIAAHISEQVAKELLKKFNRRIVVVAPAIPYGETMLTHLPGTLNIDADTLVRLVEDVCRSLVRQGFKRIVLLNAHYGNQAALSVAGRRLVSQNSELKIVMINWWALLSDTISEIRESEIGGMFHACELETSAYLAIDAKNVRLDKVKKEAMPAVFSRKFWAPDMFFPQKISWFYSHDDWPRSGFAGDPTKASEEKGHRILSTAIANLAEFVEEFREK